MGLVVYNTLSRSKEEFVPFNGRDVKMFVCGQTVYDDAHLGHAKTYINFDIIVRWLRHSGYNVTYIQNITDIEDKIINRAKERNMNPLELARFYEKRFFEDMKAIGVTENVTKFPRSFDYIDAIKEQIQTLADKRFAYYLDGDVYYDVARFKDYTKLSGMKLDELGKHRIEPKEGKINVYDFALWKAAKPGEQAWRIKVRFSGREIELNGRPGWHIEDTAMTATVFGPQYDVHGGATELIFPHHSNEIAQSEAAYGKIPFVKYWLHSGVLNIKGEKMSKSLKNFVTIREALKKYEPEVLRFLFASTHYRKEVNYAEDLMLTAQKDLRYFYSSFSLFYNMKETKDKNEDKTIGDIAKTLKAEFTGAMNDDFNTPLALSKLRAAIGGLRSFAESRDSVDSKSKNDLIKTVGEIASVFGILQSDTYKEAIPEEAYDIIKKREELRRQKSFGVADELRNELKDKYKIGIDDTEYGPVWYKVS